MIVKPVIIYDSRSPQCAVLGADIVEAMLDLRDMITNIDRKRMIYRNNIPAYCITYTPNIDYWGQDGDQDVIEFVLGRIGDAKALYAEQMTEANRVRILSAPRMEDEAYYYLESTQTPRPIGVCQALWGCNGHIFIPDDRNGFVLYDTDRLLICDFTTIKERKAENNDDSNAQNNSNGDEETMMNEITF